jgi:hypothetical protein
MWSLSVRSFINLVCSFVLVAGWVGFAGVAEAQLARAVDAIAQTPALEVRSTSVRYLEDLDLLVFVPGAMGGLSTPKN